jgi:hypothetical protein
MRPYIFTLALLPIFNHLQAQLVSEIDESKLYAQTKQLNQFFRRFNGEEDEKGERYYPKDKLYRSIKLRKKYIGILFDDLNKGINLDLKTQFAKEVLNKSDPELLDFHGGNWFAEVYASFLLKGKEVPVILFMQLENDHLGSKWVISKVHLDWLAASFKRDTIKVGRFLHPLSHELDFMNLKKAFEYSDSLVQFTTKRFIPDHLSIFLYDTKNGNLKFKTVNDVKFHFFQLDGWYFELSDYNRIGYNTGWLISNLVKINNETEKHLVQKFIYYEGR